MMLYRFKFNPYRSRYRFCFCDLGSKWASTASCGSSTTLWTRRIYSDLQGRRWWLMHCLGYTRRTLYWRYQPDLSLLCRSRLISTVLHLSCSCYGCAFELSTGKETDAYVQYMLRKVHMMWSYGVAKVILVFDGQRLPLKVLRDCGHSDPFTGGKSSWGLLWLLFLLLPFLVFDT